ncbi:MAG: alpha/beta hydrolase [Bacteroidota bacterium]
MSDLRKVLFFLFILFISNEAAYSQNSQKPYSNSHFLTIDSLELHFRTWNENISPARGKVLFIHGFIGSTYCWRMNVDALSAAGYKVVAVDLPSFGYSVRSLTFNQSQSSRGKLLWHLLDSLDGGDTTRWNICGHSMGGGTAEAMALLHPEKTKTLTIVDGMIFIHNSNHEAQFTILARQKHYKKIMLSYMKKRLITYKSVRNAIKKNYRYMPDSTVVMNYLTPLLREGTAGSILNVWANAKEITELYADGLKNIPVLVVWGKHDRTIYLRTGKRLVKHVPHAQLVVIHAAGHDPMETHPDIFNSLLVGFLNRY